MSLERHFEIVLEVAGDAPLAISHIAEWGRELRARDSPENKIRRTVARPVGCIRIARIGAAVGELTEESDVARIQIVLLISRCLPAHREQVPSALPGEVVVIVECVVGEYLGIGAVANVTGVIADALAREAHIGLSAERNADFRVAGKSEEAGWVTGNAVVPTHTRETNPRFVDDVRQRRCAPNSHRQSS